MKVIFLWLPRSAAMPRQCVAPGYRTGRVNKTLAARRQPEAAREKLPESPGTEESHLPAPGQGGSPGLRETIQTEIAFLAA